VVDKSNISIEKRTTDNRDSIEKRTTDNRDFGIVSCDRFTSSRNYNCSSATIESPDAGARCIMFTPKSI
jgi:hypothetical protein